MFEKDSTRCRKPRYSVNKLRFFTITFLLLTYLVWNVQPAGAIIGAVEDGLVAYWSFDKDTVQIKTERADLLSGLAAVVHGGSRTHTCQGLQGRRVHSL